MRLAPRAVGAVRWLHESRDRALKFRFAPASPAGRGDGAEEEAGLEWYWTEAVPTGHIGSALPPPSTTTTTLPRGPAWQQEGLVAEPGVP